MGAKVCIDTDVLIDLSRTGLISFVRKDLGICITTITAYEFVRGLAFLGRDPERAIDELLRRFSILHIDKGSIIKASEMYADLRKAGQLIPDPDLLIASVCISANKPLSTRNTRHYKRLENYGLRLVSPKEVVRRILRIAD